MIENDRLVYFHSTPATEKPEEAFMGSQGGTTNQVEKFATEDGSSPMAGTSVAGQMSDAHKYQYSNFLAALRGEEEVRVGLRENRQAIGIITGLYESARTGLPVSLDSPASTVV